jgi:hypothetical protein
MTLFQKLAYCESDLPGVSGAWPLGKKQPSANEQCGQTPSYFHKTFKAIQDECLLQRVKKFKRFSIGSFGVGSGSF